MATVPAILLIASAATAVPAFETPASAVTASAAVRASVASAIRTPAAPAAIAISAAAAERPLEAGTRIAADTRGLARELSQRFWSLSGNAGACFAGQQNYAVVNQRRRIFVSVLAGLVMLVLAAFVMFVVRFV
jgi:hypothetical protein